MPVNPTLKSLLDDLAKNGDAVSIAYAHNYLFEERIAADRQRAYEDDFAPARTDLKAWKESHNGRYCYSKIMMAGNQTPETFSEINRAAFLTGLEESQHVVRLECLDGVLKGSGLTLAELAEHLEIWRERKKPSDDKVTVEDAKAVLEDFCQKWNNERDNRPMFAAFYDEIKEDIEAPDWTSRVRDRLGLSHYDVLYPEKNIPVALMLYPVSKILKGLKKEEKERAFAVPTVLDGDLNTHFFPTPASANYGRTLDLEPDPNCERLVSEILHRRIDYAPDHFLKFGEISTPIPPHARGKALAALRNQHLFCLRYETGMEGFGEDISV